MTGQSSENWNVKLCQHYSAQQASDLRKICARGGTRTTFQSLKTPGTRENIRNPGRSEACTTRSEPKSVNIVHTSFRPISLTRETARAPPVAAAVPTSPEASSAVRRPDWMTMRALPQTFSALPLMLQAAEVQFNFAAVYMHYHLCVFYARG